MSPSPPPGALEEDEEGEDAEEGEEEEMEERVVEVVTTVGKGGKAGAGAGGVRPLTRRQRKALGLPKTRTGTGGAGKIVIPGGRYEGGGTGEWTRNGTGRLDVRGFREL
ncbi:hypothetical protein C8J57DRAFT_1304978, partial [Mycena rebaudengoi]